MANVKFEDNTAIVTSEINQKIEAALLECAAELVSQTARNTRVDTGQLKSSWASNVSQTSDGYEAAVGSPLENAIWEEFGTGEHALKGNGRKGEWVYQDEKGNWHKTTGKKPSRAFWNAFNSLKNKLINHMQNSLKGL